MGKPEDIAHTVEFLVSDNAEFITGSTLSVNGGQGKKAAWLYEACSQSFI